MVRGRDAVAVRRRPLSLALRGIGAPALAGLAACAPPPVELAGAGRGFDLVASRDVAEEAGLQEWQATGRLLRGRGCAVGDFDLDGRQDLFLANPADPSYVMLNRSSPGRFSFEPGFVADEDGLVWSASPADLDGDGDLDLFLAYGGLEGLGWNRLLLNEAAETGEATFRDVTARSGLAGTPVEVARPDTGELVEAPYPQGHMEGQWLDVDVDGDLDLWVDTTPFPSWAEPEEGGLAGRPQLWRNDGDLVFVDVAEEVGLAVAASHRFSQWLDLDRDGDLDLYANRMRLPRSAVYRNDGGRFVEITAEVGLGGADLSMPPESWAGGVADLNQDGWDDLVKFVRGYASEGPFRLGHTVLLAVGDRGFVDATGPSRLNEPFLAGYRDHEANGVMGATLRDVSGDGLPEVFLGNGGPSAGYPDAMYQSVGLREVELSEVGAQRVPVYRNVSHLTDRGSVDSGASGLPWPPYPYRTHAICVADLDGDGMQEALVMNGGMSRVGGLGAAEPDQLFEFAPSRAPSFVEVELRGDGRTVPWTPFGSTIAVTAARGRERWTVRDTLRSVEGFEAHHGTVRWLGLADADRVERIEVRWSDGSTTVVTGVEPGERILVER